MNSLSLEQNMPVSPNNLVSIINKNKSKKLVASKIIEANPNALPVIPKLIQSNNLRNDIEKDDLQVNRAILQNIHDRIQTTKQNNKNIIKLFPDIELAIQILVSSILSPKKMTDIQLNYKLQKKITISPTVSSELLTLVKDYINENYELEDNLSDIIREALFNSGAYVMAVIPESSVDDLINTDLLASYSTEDFKTKVDSLVDRMVRPVNMLVTNKEPPIDLNKDKVTPENFVKHLASESIVNITDNVKILCFSDIQDKVRSSLIKNSFKRNISITQESLDKVNYMDIFRQKSSVLHTKTLEFIKQKEETQRKSIGKPMTIKIPTESIIPVFIPGNEKDHLGYFVLLDETGKPLNTEGQNTSEINTNSFVSINTQNQNSPIQKAYNNLVSDSTNNVNVNQLFEMYKEVLEKQIYSSIKNSLYGSNADISSKNDIYFLMFTRALSNQRTNLLYIPKELVVYFAFYYNEVGVGKSLLDNLSVLSSLRAIMLFSKVMAQAKQSIDVTKVNISLDPNDPDPEKTIEQVQESVLKLRQNFLPLGINNPVDLVNWIQRAGLQFAYENNPLLPNVRIDFENADLTHTVPNSELEDDLRKQTILALGLSPETVDNGFSPEFATTVVNNNILLAKRIGFYQKLLTRHLNKLVSVLIYNDEDLRNKMREHLLANTDTIQETITEEEKELFNKDKTAFLEYYINQISENMYIELPKPDNTNITTLAMEYDVYKENLEKVLDSAISAEIFADDISGDLSTHIDTIKNVWKHALLRKWMAANNFYPEVLSISGTDDEDVENMLSVITEHLTSTMKNSSKLMTLMQEFKNATNKDLSKVSGDGADASSTSSGSSSDSEGEQQSNDSDAGDVFGDADLSL